MKTLNHDPLAQPSKESSLARRVSQNNRTGRKWQQASRPACGAKIPVPLDIVMSLLRPGELEKLRNYIIDYFAKYPRSATPPPEMDGGIEQRQE